MPSSRTGYGQGAAKFVDNFFRSYYAGKDYEEQSKRRDYLALVQGLSPQLESPDVPFSQKTKLAKILLSQAGIKDHSALENIFSEMEQLDQQDVDTGLTSSKLNIKGYEEVTAPIPDNSGPQVLDINEPAPIVDIAKTPVFKKRGDLSSRELQNIFKTRQDTIDFKQDIAKAQAIGDIQDKRELERLKAAGWKGNDEILYDQDKKQYFQQFSNPFTGEIKRYYYPIDAMPKSILEKSIIANKVTGRTKNLANAYSTVAEYEANPDSVNAADYKAAQELIKEHELSIRKGEAYIKSIEQGISGTKPIQPSQQASLDLQSASQRDTQSRLESNRLEDLSLKLSEAESQVTQFDTEYSAAGNTVRGAADNLSKAKTDLENGDIDQKQYNLIEKQFNDAVEDMNRAKAKRDKAITNRDNIQSIIKNRGTKSLNSISNLDTLIEKNRDLINQVRAKNPNTKLTDRQIMQAILNKANKN